MLEEGKIYVPEACDDGQQCHVHFAFHSNGGFDFDDDDNPYTKFAASNNIIVVFPIFEAGYGQKFVLNPTENTKDGVFPRVIMGMIDILENGGSCPEQ